MVVVLRLSEWPADLAAFRRQVCEALVLEGNVSPHFLITVAGRQSSIMERPYLYITDTGTTLTTLPLLLSKHLIPLAAQQVSRRCVLRVAGIAARR